MSDLIDKKALERIVRRAAELQAGAAEIGDGLTSKEVLALGKDVGIPEGYLRQAMLEEQTRAADEGSIGTWGRTARHRRDARGAGRSRLGRARPQPLDDG
jgi:hypothetical protein